MKYDHIQIKCYNGEDPNTEDQFHCELNLGKQELTFTELMRTFITPAMNCVFHRMIPDMPQVMKPADLEKLDRWESKYFGAQESHL